MNWIVPPKIIVFAMLLGISFPLKGQEYLESGWSLEYYADFFNHPGVRLGFEKTYKEKWKQKVRNDITLTTHKLRARRLAIVYYHHKDNHRGLALIPELQFKKVNHKGWFRAHTYGLGLHQSFLAGDLYRKQDDGSFSRHFAGQTTGIITLDLSIGRDLRFYKGKDYAWHLGLGGNLRFPFNGLFLPGTFLHAGFTHYPSHAKQK